MTQIVFARRLRQQNYEAAGIYSPLVWPLGPSHAREGRPSVGRAHPPAHTSRQCAASNAGGLVKEAQDLASRVLPLGLLVIHDAIRRRQDDVAELARRQQVDDPLLNVAIADVKARRDDTALVNPSDQIDNDLAAAVIIDNLELTNVACREDCGAHSMVRNLESAACE
eukprot:CAMPEP_0115835906 /NCGR_PEP_ID=MMETSP0287-20121206/4436_1 /TAXON_ID=412157 /ORGANISM="Chrysochromulina rotalis, Strain UIO044" /LENGTH=167 /DNA_ID=CAMNT_0003289379 /DNA_START=172 /DNA_END=675 /DNA_ORIENTATION=+